MNKESLMKKKITELVKLIKNILLQANISEEQKIYAKDCANELVDLTNGSDAKAYVFLGKINVLLKDNHAAIDSFRRALSINSLLPSPYYGLFKIYMEQGKYDFALENIKKYESYSGIDCEIYTSLINIYLYNKDIMIDNKDNVFGHYKMNEPIMRNYNLGIDSINKGNYEQALKHIRVCIKLIKKDNYHIDLTILENLLVKINSIHSEIERKKQITSLKEQFLSNDNYGFNYLCLKRLLELESDDINILILLIECCISLVNYNDAKYYLELAKSKLNIPNTRLDYLEKKINSMSKDPRNYLKELRNKLSIEKLVLANDIEAALDLCELYTYETDDPNYIYIAGVILYKYNYYEEALNYFERYRNYGSSYLKQTYYYLYYIYNWLNDNEKANYYATMIYDLSKYEGLDISLPVFESQLLFYAHNFSDECMIELEKKLLSNVLEYENKQKIIDKKVTIL